MSEPVLSRKRQGAQDAVDTLETFEAFEAFDKHGLPAFVRGVDAEALYFFLALFSYWNAPACGRAARHQSLERQLHAREAPHLLGRSAFCEKRISDAADHSGQTPL